MRSGLIRGNRLFFANLTLLALLCLLITLIPFPALKAYMTRGASVEVLDHRGSTLYVEPLDGGMRRQYRRLDEIPVDVRSIFTRAEDKRFFLHFGLDPVALVRSAFRFFSYGDSASGASTVTMQLARMVLDAAGPRTKGRWARKIEEIIAAVRIEARLSKERILELWLNGIPFGHQVEGVASAAKYYFDTDLHSLTTAQLLSLALIPRNPTLYNPIDNPVHVAANVIRLADELKVPIDRETAWSEIGKAGLSDWPDEAPHFSRAVSAAAEGLYGKLLTTLELDLQRLAENLLQVHLDSTADSRIENGAVLVVENATGSIRAYVGSQDFYSSAGGQIDGVRIRNQPGSTIKPFLYAFALELGFEPNDLLADVPTDFGGEEVYVPRNFDRGYHGQVRFRTALASSLNIPAATLLQRLGVFQFASFLIDLGFESVADDRLSGTQDSGLGMALGNTPVTLYELVRGFSVFPRGGVYRDLRWRDAGEEPETGGRRVVSQSTAWVVFDMLSDPPERVTGFGMDDPFWAMPGAAVKTGTSSRGANIWALAATGEHTVGVWLGNFAGETVIGRTGSSVPAIIALEILKHAEHGGEPPRPNPPPGLRSVEICSFSGMTAGTYCPATRLEYFAGEAPPVCTLHTGESDHRYDSYYSAAGEAPLLQIRSPIEDAVFYFDKQLPADTQAVRVEVQHPQREAPELFVNGNPAVDPLFDAAKGVTSWIVPLVPGRTALVARCGSETVRRGFEVR